VVLGLQTDLTNPSTAPGIFLLDFKHLATNELTLYSINLYQFSSLSRGGIVGSVGFRQGVEYIGRTAFLFELSVHSAGSMS
jgi:hypothetical protein